jgi:Calcineurin-like phosphoesterase
VAKKVKAKKTKQTKARPNKSAPASRRAARQARASNDSSTALPAPVFHEPVFNEGQFLPDPTGFSTPHDEKSDNALYKKLGDLLKTDVVSFDKARGKPSDLLALSDAYGPHGPEVIGIINTNKRIVFHAIGDSGATSAGKKYGHELSVADHVTNDCRTSAEQDRPAFLFHLGDVVYDFGEPQYYYDQFYEPFRNYPAPIFAIPGNHDSFLVPGTPSDKQALNTFIRNFCATAPAITAEAKSLHRTAMTQPGVYFALDAPFVRIIGLFSNALEDPGVISSETENGKKTWPTLPDYQLDFLTAQFQQIKDEKYKGAVIIAVHHPPFSYEPPPATSTAAKGKKSSGAGGDHGKSTDMLRQIDTICKAQGVYPHAFLSGHAHNYQRYTRTVHFQNKDCSVPFIVCGDGGYNVKALVQGHKGSPAQPPQDGTDVSYLDIRPAVQAGKLILGHSDPTHYGYLRIAVDAQKLAISFYTVPNSPEPTTAATLAETVTVDLTARTVTVT